MPTIAEHLQTARENFAQQLAELSNPLKRKPSYSIGGRSVQWTEYLRFLREQVKELDADLAALEGDGITVTAVE